MLIYKCNAIQSQILTCFFPPRSIILSELPLKIGHALLNLFQRKSTKLKCIFQHFQHVTGRVVFFCPGWLYVLYRTAASSPVLSTSTPLPSYPSGTRTCPQGRECWREPTEFSVYFSTSCNCKLSVFSYADVGFVLFYLLCSFILTTLEKKVGISIYMACIALTILALQMRKLKTKNSHSSNIK